MWLALVKALLDRDREPHQTNGLPILILYQSVAQFFVTTKDYTFLHFPNLT